MTPRGGFGLSLLAFGLSLLAMLLAGLGVFFWPRSPLPGPTPPALPVPSPLAVWPWPRTASGGTRLYFTVRDMAEEKPGLQKPRQRSVLWTKRRLQTGTVGQKSVSEGHFSAGVFCNPGFRNLNLCT